MHKRHPYLFRDSTVTVRDTVYTQRTHVDTFAVMNSSRRDSLVLTRDNLRVVVHKHFDSIWVMADVAPDTIYRTIRVPVKVAQVNRKIDWQSWLIPTVLTVLVMLVIVWLLRGILSKTNV
jgi:hypothetical protein